MQTIRQFSLKLCWKCANESHRPMDNILNTTYFSYYNCEGKQQKFTETVGLKSCKNMQNPRGSGKECCLQWRQIRSIIYGSCPNTFFYQLNFISEWMGGCQFLSIILIVIIDSNVFSPTGRNRWVLWPVIRTFYMIITYNILSWHNNYNQLFLTAGFWSCFTKNFARSITRISSFMPISTSF